MKPKVVILSAFLTPFRSGAEACAEEVAQRLLYQYDVTIVTARMRRSLPREDMLGGLVPVIRVGWGTPLDKWLFPFLAPWVVRRVQPRLVHAVLETYAGLALRFCTVVAPSAIRLLTLQTTNTQFLKGWIVSAAHHVTVISRALADVAQQYRDDEITLIPNGVQTDQIAAACERHAIVPERILFVGRLEPMKGVDTLLEAFSKIVGCELRIVGDGSQRRRLENLAEEYEIAHRVTFLGQLTPPELYDEFAQADIFCGLSRSEALGNVFIEAQAAACAVLATDVGGIPDVVQDGVTGVLVPPNDSDAAMHELTMLLVDEGRRNSMRAAGQRNAQQYDWSIIAKQYEMVYKKMLS